MRLGITKEQFQGSEADLHDFRQVIGSEVMQKALRVMESEHPLETQNIKASAETAAAQHYFNVGWTAFKKTLLSLDEIPEQAPESDEPDGFETLEHERDY